MKEPMEALSVRVLLQQYFPELNEKEAVFLAQYTGIRTFARGEMICGENVVFTSLALVLSGDVKVVRSTAQGREHILLLVHPGRILDAGVLFGNGRIIGAAVALSAGKLLCVERDPLLQVLESNGRLGLALLNQIAVRQRMLAHKLAGSQGHISVRRRVAGWLLHRSRVERSLSVRSLVSREVMAGQLGIARESLSRQLHLLAREGFIRLEPGSIVLLNAEALQTAALE